MELLCPHCQKKLAIAETYSGQVVRCPECAATFTAPALAPAAGPVPLQPEPAALLPPDLGMRESEPPVLAIEPLDEPPPPAPFGAGSAEGYRLAAEPPAPAASAPKVPGPASQTVSPMPVAAPINDAAPLPAPETAPTKASPKSEYAHRFTMYFRREAVAWLAPAGLVALFFLSFFPWEGSDFRSANLWQLAYSPDGYISFRFYVLFFFLAWPFSIAALLLQKKCLLTPDQLKGFLPWSSLVLAGLTLVPFFLFLNHYVRINVYGFVNPSTIGMKVAFRVHFLVVAGALLHFWLERRSARKLPEPRWTMRW